MRRCIVPLMRGIYSSLSPGACMLSAIDERGNAAGGCEQCDGMRRKTGLASPNCAQRPNTAY